MKGIVVWNSWSRCYVPHMRENLLPVRIIRRQKATPEDTCTDLRPPYLLYCGGCTWTRINRQPVIIAITWHFSRQTLLEPLTVDDRSERFLFRWTISGCTVLEFRWSTQRSTDCCTLVCKQTFQLQYVCVCVCVFIKLHITTQSGPVILVILCHSH